MSKVVFKSFGKWEEVGSELEASVHGSPDDLKPRRASGGEPQWGHGAGNLGVPKSLGP